MKHAGYILSGIILALGILGARLQNTALMYAMLGFIILAILLVVYDKIQEKQYPFLLFFIGLGLIYQFTLMSNYLVGTDIHYEYYFALQTFNSGAWDSTIGHSYNSAMSISVFLPVMADLLHIPLEWAFKVIPPLFLAGIPVVTYYIFKKEFEHDYGLKAAFLAVFFFISIPTMFLELSGLAKQAIGELFLVMCLALVAYNFFNLRWGRYVLIGLLAILTAVSHYSMGGTLFCYLLGAVVLMLAGKYILKIKPDIKIKYLAVAFGVFVAFSGIFYGWAAQGAPLRDITMSARITSGVVTRPTSVIDSEDVPTMPNVGAVEDSQYTHWVYPEPAVAVALGADFMEVDAISKIFRVFQYATQTLIIIGVVAILIHYRRRSLGYMALLCLSGILLAMVVFYPGFSPIFNASRFYNLVLLFMSPAAIVGGKLIFRNYKVLTIAILIPYFLFTTGVIFEATKIKDLTVITLPYSHALSANRIDSTGIYTANDIAARDWVKANNKFPVYGDMWGATAIFEVQSNMADGVNKLLQGDNRIVHVFVYPNNAPGPEPVMDNAYIFLRERNTEKKEITYQTGVGLRRIRSYEDAGFLEVLEGREIIYQAGNAIVYGVKNDS